MKIAFAAALLLGLASARNILTSLDGTYDMIATTPLTISGEYTFDIGYSTSFGIAEDSTDAYLWVANYGLEVDSYGSYTMTFNFFDVISYELSVTATIFDITPYNQYLTVTRPDAILYDSSATYEVMVSAEYDIELGQVEVTHTPDVLVTSVDLYDALDNVLGGTFTLSDWIPTAAADWAFQADDDVSITDSYLYLDVPVNFLGFSDTDAYYGTHEIYSYTFSL